MYNTKDSAGEDVPIYSNEGYVVLKVKELLADFTYSRKFTEGVNTLEMHLKHDPIPCNYVHTVFELVLNGSVVTYDDYKKTLKKDKYKELKDKCRDELQKMIFRRQLVLNDFK